MSELPGSSSSPAGQVIPAGHLPVSVHMPELRFDVLDLTGEQFEEPFTAFTIERHLDALRLANASILNCGPGPIHATAGLAPGPPLGFIFHTGRCGSSLLGNMLNRRADVVVLREVQAVNDISALVLRPTNTSPAAAALLRDLLLTFARDVVSPPRSLIYKWTSWSAPLLPHIAAMFPGTPSVFVFRDPVDVVRSFLTGVPHWADVLFASRAEQAMSHPAVLRLDPERPVTAVRFYVAAWLTQVEAALAEPSERVLFVDYDDLVHRPLQVIRLVEAHLGAAGPGAAEEDIASERGYYSKRRDTTEVYDPTIETQRVSLRSSTRHEIRELTDLALTRLRARSSGSLGSDHLNQ